MSAHQDQQTAPRVRDAITRRGRIGVEPVPRGQRLTRPQGFVERSPSVPVGSPITQPQAHVKVGNLCGLMDNKLKPSRILVINKY